MKILLAVDGSKFTKKMLAYLASHAGDLGTGNEFTVINAQLPLPPRARSTLGGTAATRQYHAELAAEILEPAVKFLSRRGERVKSTWKVGPAGESIARFASEGKFDLVVMGSHGWGALGGLVLSSVTTQVLARCRVPVLVIR